MYYKFIIHFYFTERQIALIAIKKNENHPILFKA